MKRRRDFNKWLESFRSSIASYEYYTNFEKIFKNVNDIKIELNILNSLIGSQNIKEDFENIIEKYPETLKCIPILLAVRTNEIYVTDVNGEYVYSFKNRNYPADQYSEFMEKTGLFKLLKEHIVNNLFDYVTGVETGLDSNGRKNRGGHLREDLVESCIQNSGFEKNKNYWNAKNIKIPSIKYIKSTDFRIVDNLIKNNEIDMSRVESYHLEEYKKENKLDSFLNGRIWYLEYNLENKDLQNLKIRKAISMAIDREKYVKEIKKDGSKVAKSLIGKDIDGFDKKYREIYPDDTYISNDIVEAKKLYNEGLNEIGKKELTLNLLSGNSDPEVLEVQFIQEELRTKLGINVNVQTVPFKERLNKTRSGEYDITLNTWSPKYNDVLSYLERWQNKNPKTIWSKEKYNELLKEIHRLNSSSERDLKANMAEKIIIDEVVVAPLYFAIENHYRNPKIKGIVRRSITGITDFRWAYID